MMHGLDRRTRVIFDDGCAAAQSQRRRERPETGRAALDAHHESAFGEHVTVVQSQDLDDLLLVLHRVAV